MAYFNDKDVMLAQADYPHVPRAILETLDFYLGHAVERPHIIEGKRPQLEAMLLLSGCSYVDDCVITDDTVILVGILTVYLDDVEQYFKRIYHGG